MNQVRLLPFALATLASIVLLAGCESKQRTSGNGSSGSVLPEVRPSRPQEAIIGHWARTVDATVIDGKERMPAGKIHLVIRKHGANLMIAKLFPNGAVDEFENVIEKENVATGELVTQTYYTNEDTGGKGRELAKFGDGRDMLVRRVFNDARTQLKELHYHYDGSWTDYGTFTYIDKTTDLSDIEIARVPAGE